ncbi:exostosin family protein [Parasediminibacterium sp. JCM 36343]|uniref:exostosin domain-containing protein n=1 Tax=Parasediminibacterium sp. JCM 36343 TaxID=3374279 RepID=UPI00397DD6F6
MLKIFTDFDILQYGDSIEMLIPFIGMHEYDTNPNNVICGRYNQWFKEGKGYLQIVDNIEDADVAILPVNYPIKNGQENAKAALSAYLGKVKASGKKIFVFTGHDIHNLTVPIENAIIFDGAMNKSSQPANRYSWPHFFEDFIEKYKDGNITLRNKTEKPVIGFSGYSPPLEVKFGKEKLISAVKLIANYLGLMKHFPALSSHSYRSRALIGLKKSKKITSNFRIKPNFGFGPIGLNSGATNETNQEFRVNFINNIVNSDYTLCVRGIGNNSVRFFETLCCGRIPIFLNTDCVLPFDHIIDWKKYCVWVEEKDIDNIANIVADFHNNISNDDFLAMQKNARAIWLEYLSPVGFFKNMQHFIK